MTRQTSLHRTTTAVIFALGLLLVPAASYAQEVCPIANFTPDPEFTSSFMVEKCKWTLKGGTPFFPLLPGWQTVLESDPDPFNGEPGEVAVITVLNETRKVDGVRTRVVEELAFEKDGEELIPIERSLNFYAICEQTGSVFYFGEDSMELDENGDVIATTGSWLAGIDGAKAGIIMPGTILVGGGYYEEVAPANSALDKARIKGIHASCEMGKFDLKQCVETFNTSDCDLNAAEPKFYAPGIGNVKDQGLELTRYGFKNKHRHGHDQDDD
jgi:hypothetical protein